MGQGPAPRHARRCPRRVRPPTSASTAGRHPGRESSADNCNSDGATVLGGGADMKRLVSRMVVGVGVGVAVYIGFSAWVGFDEVHGALRKFNWGWALLACLLALVNY